MGLSSPERVIDALESTREHQRLVESGPRKRCTVGHEINTSGDLCPLCTSPQPLVSIEPVFK